jgi:hypothetical protein
MSKGLSREQLDAFFNEQIKTRIGQIEAMDRGENPTLAEEFIKLEASSSDNVSKEFRNLSLFIGIVSSAILDTIAANNEAI